MMLHVPISWYLILSLVFSAVFPQIFNVHWHYLPFFVSFVLIVKFHWRMCSSCVRYVLRHMSVGVHFSNFIIKKKRTLTPDIRWHCLFQVATLSGEESKQIPSQGWLCVTINTNPLPSEWFSLCSYTKI